MKHFGIIPATTKYRDESRVKEKFSHLIGPKYAEQIFHTRVFFEYIEEGINWHKKGFTLIKG